MISQSWIGFLVFILMMSAATLGQATCPVGRWVKSSDTDFRFNWRLGKINKECRILNPQVFAEKGAIVAACVPGERGETYFVEPLGRTINDCHSMDQPRLALPAEKFTVQNEPPPTPTSFKRTQPASIFPIAAVSRDGKSTPAERIELAKKSYQRGDGIAAKLDDLMVENTGIKSSTEIDEYTSCMLSQTSRESEARKKYQENYRAMIAFASRTYRVPIGLLSCTCGRESRYASSAQNDGATGLCQATGGFLEEINKWINKPGAAQNEWRDYIDSLGARLEHSSCRNTPITKEMIKLCPSLGLGTSAIYLRHIFARFEGKSKDSDMGEADWGRQSVESFAVASGAYNVGVSFADNVLDGVTNRKGWPNHLLKKTCESWLVRSDDPVKRKIQLDRAKNKFSEVKNHLVAVRNCLQKDNFLDHQGNPMNGACGGTDAQKKKQLASLQKFKSSLPVRCESGHTSNAPVSSNDAIE